MLTEGRVVSGGGPFETVTLTAAEVLVLPAASRARAVMLWLPFDAVFVSHDTEYGADASSLPRAAPSTKNCTPATRTLSEALACSVMVFDTVAPDAGEVTETFGAV